jgi:hypothetical protein
MCPGKDGKLQRDVNGMWAIQKNLPSRAERGYSQSEISLCRKFTNMQKPQNESLIYCRRF